MAQHEVHRGEPLTGKRLILEDAKISNMRILFKDLRGAIFRRVVIDSVNMEYLDLEGVTFEDSTITNCKFRLCDFSSVKFNNVNEDSLEFSNCSLWDVHKKGDSQTSITCEPSYEGEDFLESLIDLWSTPYGRGLTCLLAGILEDRIAATAESLKELR